MITKYCWHLDEEKFIEFAGARAMTEAQLGQLRLLHLRHISADEEGRKWEVHFAAPFTPAEGLLRELAAVLQEAFAVSEVTFVNEGEPAASPVPSAEQKNTAVSGKREAALQKAAEQREEEKKREPSPEEAEFLEAQERLFGGKKKKEGQLWGKAFKERKPRPLAEIKEEENGVVVAGTFTKSVDRTGALVPFIQRELRTGSISLVFNLCDESDGIFVKLRFDREGEVSAKDACAAFTAAVKPGMKLLIRGNVAPDRFLNDELALTPTGIRRLETEEREDRAPVKRTELHCHTKMSKLDAVTDMKALVEQAQRWGHKALAITDHGVVQAFPFCYDALGKGDLKLIFGMEGYLIDDRNFEEQAFAAPFVQKWREKKGKGRERKNKYFHIIILAKNQVGLRNLYKLVSFSHLRHYLGNRPQLPRELLEEYREGLLFGSACEMGELYRALEMGAPDEVLEQVASFYDYLEIQPLGNNGFLVRDGLATEEQLRENNRRIVELGRRLGKLTVATCDTHFLNPEDSSLRAVLQYNYADSDQQPPLYFRTTEEMLAEFAYLGKETAYEVCVVNSNKIADEIERLKPVPDSDQLYSPYIPGVEEEVRSLAYKKAKELYGDPLPELVEERLQTELNSIIGHGYAVLYYIAHKLVTRSLERSYLVGSRGSVGSSLVAFLIDITEINALKPHYRCPKCRYTRFFLQGEVDSGFDLPPATCPHCGATLVRDGHDIPFAVFMGFHGDKVPDIDLNFSGEEQAAAHKYTEELLGRDNVCRAGTISTVAAKTAISYVLKYCEKRGRKFHPAKAAAIAAGLEGVKRTTGQHPGGIMVIPRNMDIHYITPMNRPADEVSAEVITTHYDYHSINDRLVKLDLLGHDDPTMIKMLEDLTGVKVKEIPVGDEATMQLFQNTASLGVTPEQILSPVGTLGVPECGTNFVRQMINDVKPKTFSEIVRVSGYSHGTDVWLNNAQDLILAGRPVKETISTRDDIMTGLIAKGVEPLLAFKTMEYVRKGKAAKKGLEPQMLEAMRKANVPQWYIDSCQKVQYLFPKAHAVAYVLMGYRIAYWKVHYPKEYYAAFFSKRAKEFDIKLALRDKADLKAYIKEVYERGYKASEKDKNSVIYLELVNEMLERGFDLEPPDLYKSDALNFSVTEKGVLAPLNAINGLGPVAAQAIAKGRSGEPFYSWEDIVRRTGVGKSTVEKLAEAGLLEGLPENDQLSLFDL